MADQSAQDRELMRRWVETWQRAGKELDEIRCREIAATDNREAIRQLFEAGAAFPEIPPTTSGLVEQQAWFAKLRR